MAFIQRNYPRILMRTPVTITINDYALQKAECLSISMGGMCITVKDTIEKQQKGVVKLERIFDNEKICFKGEFSVCWIRVPDDSTLERQFGLQFTYFDSANLNNLARIIIEELRQQRVENQ